MQAKVVLVHHMYMYIGYYVAFLTMDGVVLKFFLILCVVHLTWRGCRTSLRGAKLVWTGERTDSEKVLLGSRFGRFQKRAI
jgi:hypothetical protein